MARYGLLSRAAPVLIGMAIAAPPAFAQGAPSNPDEIKLLKGLVRKQQEALESQQRALDKQRRELEALRTRINTLEAPRSEPASRTVLGPPFTTDEATRMRAGQMPERPVGEAPPPEEPRPVDVTLLEELGGGVLTPKGRLTIEPSLEYTNSSTDRFIFRGVEILPAFLIGVIDITEADRDSIFASVTGRLGITDRLEIEARVPFAYRNDRLTTTVAREGADDTTLTTTRKADAFDLGDIELAAHYQINRGLDDWPIFIGNLRFKTDTGTSPFEVDRDVLGLETELPTGSGFYGLEPSLTAIYPTEPAVFFANVGYLWNIGRDVDTTIAGSRIGHVDPGDAIRASFGMGFGINERASFSLGYEHSYVFETTTEIDGVDTKSDPLHVGSLLLGFSYRVSESVGLNLSVAAGVTENAPDTRITARVPISFNLF